MVSNSSKGKKRLTAIKPFILTRRFVTWGKRHAVHNDENGGKATSKSLQGESDGGDSTLDEEEEQDRHLDDHEDSESTRYSDAHSTWELPVINRDGVIPVSISALLNGGEAVPSVEETSDPMSRLISTDTNDLLDMPSGGEASDEIQLSRLLGEVVPTEHSQPYEFYGDGQFGDASRAEQHFESARPQLSNNENLEGLWDGTPRNLDKGKGVELGPNWSTSKNPWEAIDAALHEESQAYTKLEERQVLVEENARLRLELEALRASILSQPGLFTAQPESASQSQTPWHPHRPRKLKLKHKPWPDTTLFERTTLRDLVFKHLFASHLLVDTTAPFAMDQRQDTPLTLDTPLTPDQIHSFSLIMKSLLLSGQPLKQPIALCAVCHLPKFKETPGKKNNYISAVLAQMEPSINYRDPSSSVPGLEDFHPVWGTSTCCRRYVCKACLGGAICRGISTQWWFDLGAHEMCWLKCPVPICGRSLPLTDSNDLLEVLQILGVPNSEEHVSRFERVSQLRAALQRLSPLPGKEAARRSRILHERLLRYGRIWPLLDKVPSTDDQQPQVKAELVSLDTANGQSTVRVPIFTHLLHPLIPQTCIVCLEVYNEFCQGDSQSWTKAIRPLPGDWTWQIHHFPISDILPSCQHELHVCRTCLSRHITSQIESNGYNAVGNITCPTPECEHRYTHGEIRCLATPEVFTAYDRLAVLNEVSNLPHFRWCLREGCNAGGLYEDPLLSSSSPSSPLPTSGAPDQETNENNNNQNNQATVASESSTLILCGECHYQMCYTCQTPWHPDLTCAQVRSVRDPRNQTQQRRTHRWLARNTKPCPGPGCGVPVQKGDGCFHMTCSRCRYEFCWECLADWRGIVDQQRGVLLREGHARDCYFAREGARLPTQVMGAELAVGLRRAEGDEVVGLVNV